MKTITKTITIAYDDFHDMILGDLQYCFGRMTTAPFGVQSTIQKHWHELAPATKERIIYFTEHAIYTNELHGEYTTMPGRYFLGMKCDVESWKDFLAWCKNEDVV